ncbi:MAG: YggS family pyridoxal phosphate-dependent enzyme [Ignavibacteriota bacterium]|nr:YggS family pyridoxal phosphate-dependent enzyme [Ignavibacteriota bacterium]
MDKQYLNDNYDALIKDIKATCEQTGRDFSEITLVAVSKTFPAEDVVKVRESGQIHFGENKVQELKSKFDILGTENINWHLIGHLQTNKVKYVADFVYLIHSVDSLKLAEVIDEQAKKYNRIIDILIQVNTSSEDQKSGIEPSDAGGLCAGISKLENVRIKGLMTIGMFTDDEDVIRDNFKTLKSVYDELKADYPSFEYLSMGMTSDYKIAIEEGANMLRIGSAIFGYRNYSE